MEKRWSDNAWEEYLYWQLIDKDVLKKINELLKSIEREGPAKGLGKPELLKSRTGYSRRITKEHRLVYDVKNGVLIIYSCKGHYED
ncbi:MAG: Txe/YoeB family addiction module toxin [Firmicutes bacterium]|jgi:toxin YoeB|nr:Txe/YoeB family addiction module toxin [Bacillota bacterium]